MYEQFKEESSEEPTYPSVSSRMKVKVALQTPNEPFFVSPKTSSVLVNHSDLQSFKICVCSLKLNITWLMVLAHYISRNIHYGLFCVMLVLSNAAFLSVIHDDMCNDSQFIIAACRRFHHVSNAIYLSLQSGWMFVLFPVWICYQPCCHQHSGHQSWRTQKTLFKNRILNSGSLGMRSFNLIS